MRGSADQNRGFWTRLTSYTRRLNRGKRGETLAAKFLKKQGHRVLARNLRNRFGEIDLVTQTPEGLIAIVEVKTGTPGQALPETRVNHAKQRRLTALAAQFARQHRMESRAYRFDIVAVELSERGDPVIRHIPAAFASAV